MAYDATFKLKTGGQMRVWSPIDIQPGHVGGLEVRHILVPAGESLEVIGTREYVLQKIYGGTRHGGGKKGVLPVSVVFPHDIVIHELLDEDGRWVADLPIEMRQHEEMVSILQPRRKVLVGGLGLGMAVHLIAASKYVTKIDVVEKDERVCQLIADSLPTNIPVNVICDDIYDFLTKLGAWTYHSAFFDTWRGTGESTWWEEVMPLKRLIGYKFGAVRTMYWAEDQMISQVQSRLMSLAPEQKHWYYRMDNLPMGQMEANEFVSYPGWEGWERKYGHLYGRVWDKDQSKEGQSNG